MYTEVSQIEEHIDWLKENMEYGNYIKTLDVQLREKSEAWRFAQCGELHYFAARVMLRLEMHDHGLFWGQQCIECVMKALLIDANVNIPRQSHDLRNLLESVRRSCEVEGSFLMTERAITIIDQFNPFYEISRYPNSYNQRPQIPYVIDGHSLVMMLDYFVYKMFEELLIPENTWDLLREGRHYGLEVCRIASPEIFSLFQSENINFPQ